MLTDCYGTKFHTAYLLSKVCQYIKIWLRLLPSRGRIDESDIRWDFRTFESFLSNFPMAIEVSHRDSRQTIEASLSSPLKIASL